MLKKIQTSLATRSILCLYSILFTILASLTTMNILNQNRIMFKRNLEEVDSFANLILISIRHPMMQGDQDTIQLQFDNYSKFKKIEVIHLLDDKGIIRRSSDRSLMGEMSMANFLKRALNGEEFHGIEVRKRTGKKVFTKMRQFLTSRNATLAMVRKRIS